MSKIRELLKQRRYDDLWQMCCGFLDLSVEQFMTIQENLLLEQIELLRESELGRKVMRGAMPVSIEEFRAQVPMTTYTDYCPELLERNEGILPTKPALWIQTSGRSGEYPHKWVPVSRRFWQEAAINFCAIASLSSCEKKGEVAFKGGEKLLHAAALPPFLTGNVARKIAEDIGFKFIPSHHEAEKMTFEQRVDKGFKLALSGGMDGFFGLAGILVAIGEKFRQGSGNISFLDRLSKPRETFRLARGLIRSKMAGRPIMPKDMWLLKMIVSMGTDSKIYKNKIMDLWGRAPLDIYGNSETTLIATQTWDYNDMVFFPNLNFLEFIPEKEYINWKVDNNYKPKTVLLDEVKAGENYELVVTNFNGGALVRYRIGDIVRITTLRNERLGIDLPQMVFERRADDLIDLGFMRLTERVVWQAIENAKIPYRGWTACKELGNTPRLHLYIEPDNYYSCSAPDMAKTIYEQIKQLDDGLYVYEELPSLEELIEFKPIVVTLLPEGTFANYKNLMSATGTNFADLRPPHINPSDKVLSLLRARTETSAIKKAAVSR